MTPGLTIENFTFYKEALGADPQFETIRNARNRGFSPIEAATPKSGSTPSVAKTRTERTSSDTSDTKDTTPVREPSPVKESTKATPLKNFVKTPKDSGSKPPPPKREKLVLKVNKGTPKIALKKSLALNGGRNKLINLLTFHCENSYKISLCLQNENHQSR